MIKHYMVFDKTSGLFLSRLTADEDQLACNTPSGCDTVEGLFDHLSQRVDIASGQVVDYRPPAPSDEHEWNASTKRHQLTAAAAEKESKRDFALNRIDHLENSQARALREAALGSAEARARLQAIDDEIASLRSQVKL